MSAPSSFILQQILHVVATGILNLSFQWDQHFQKVLELTFIDIGYCFVCPALKQPLGRDTQCV